MNRRADLARWGKQAILYALFMVPIGYLSSAPAYRYLEHDQAMLKVSLRHSGLRLGACHRLDAEELARLSPMMRATEQCPRERSPLLLELEINGVPVLSERLEPRGIHKDGVSTAYHNLRVPAGKLQLTVRMKDHLEQQEFPYVLERLVELAPQQVLVVDFDAAQHRFVFL